MSERCKECGAALPQWPDIAAALESMLELMPIGLRPVATQAIRELRQQRDELHRLRSR